jgi:hypothetical protein
MDLSLIPVGTSLQILPESFADGGRRDPLPVQPSHDAPYTYFLLRIPAEDLADHAGFRFIHLSFAIDLVTPIAI